MSQFKYRKKEYFEKRINELFLVKHYNDVKTTFLVFENGKYWFPICGGVNAETIECICKSEINEINSSNSLLGFAFKRFLRKRRILRKKRNYNKFNHV